ncbi:MAG: sugar ABC transporter permease [Dactylosporangium sp.]|nr:sugar ABC transporter permease [Dactylosporangium sp.]NNJ61641.1 sugar ABC transporter permease [Dactylosporangium sp.]
MTTASVSKRHPSPSAGATAKRRRPQRGPRREGLAGYIFLSPWLLGLMGITAAPMLISLYLSFTDYGVLTGIGEAEWVGLDNYKRMLTEDPAYWHSVIVTIKFALISVPLKLSAALAVAMLLNRDRIGIGLYRGLFYLPSLLGGSVGLAIVWVNIFNREGAFNAVLDIFGLPTRPWINEPGTALWTLIVLAIWQFGSPMVIFLAGLKQIPGELYEAASVDGAGKMRKFFHVTIPMLSPVIFFNLVMEIIKAFEGFTGAFVVSGGTGGPVDSTLMYTLYLYIKAFTDFEMGYASAMAWIFLVTLGIITVLLFNSGKFWVHYSDEGDG